MDCKSTWSCNVDPGMNITAGTEIILPNVWGHIKGGITPEKNISVKLDKDQTLIEALCLVEAAATSFVRKHGAEDIRHYYIENVMIDEKQVEFDWGT